MSKPVRTAHSRAPRILASVDPASLGPPPEQLQDLVGKAIVLLRRGVLTLRALPDPDRRYRSSPRSALPAPQPDYDPTYDEQALKSVTPAPRFIPTRRDLSRVDEVMSWLAWLKRQGEEEGQRYAEVIAGRALGRPFWKLAKRRHRVSDDTLRRWEIAGATMIVGRFWKRVEELAR